MLKGTITLNDQECEGTYNFGNTEKYMTKGFKNRFGDEAEELIAQSIEKSWKNTQTMQITSKSFTMTIPNSI